MLTGDRHFSEISVMRDTPAGYPMIDFTSSGLTHHATLHAERMPNRYRTEGAFFNDLSFGTVEIDWEARKVLLRAHDVEGNEAFVHKVSLASLRSDE